MTSIQFNKKVYIDMLKSICIWFQKQIQNLPKFIDFLGWVVGVWIFFCECVWMCVNVCVQECVSCAWLEERRRWVFFPWKRRKRGEELTGGGLTISNIGQDRWGFTDIYIYSTTYSFFLQHATQSYYTSFKI